LAATEMMHNMAVKCM